jgi:hypothetical protein
LIVLVTAVLAFFVACAIALIFELEAAMLQYPELAARWSRLKSHLRFH